MKTSLTSPKGDRTLDVIEAILLGLAVVLMFVLAIVNIGRGWLW